jgi:hypothetical protein
MTNAEDHASNEAKLDRLHFDLIMLASLFSCDVGGAITAVIVLFKICLA